MSSRVLLRCLRAWALGLAGLALAACTPADQRAPEPPRFDGGMRYIGTDDVGCAQFTADPEPGTMAPAVIYYRDGEGGFTMVREEADCPPLPTTVPRTLGEPDPDPEGGLRLAPQ